MDQNNFKKVFHTALVIAPPIAHIQEIQHIRAAHDKSYERWMPHVNICFPFADPQNFNQVFNTLQDHLKDFPAFEVTLRAFKQFDHGKQCVLWLDPETEDNNIVKLFDTIQEKYPQLNDLGKKSEAGYCPHISVGQFPKNQIQQQAKKFQNGWQAEKFLCQEIHMIAREGQEGSFNIIHTIRLKSNIYENYTYLGDINNRQN